MRWAKHVAGMGDIKSAYKIYVPKRRDHSEDINVATRIILKCIFGKSMGECGLDSCVLGYGPVAGSCEHGNELSGSIKAGNFLTT
jgi:hypothetical protein